MTQVFFSARCNRETEFTKSGGEKVVEYLKCNFDKELERFKMEI
jgi:hypothetical protein